MAALREWENWAIGQGYCLVAGVDEAGRGPLAGPVVACACLLPALHSIEGINDSKKLLPDFRRKVYEKLICHPEVIYGVGIVEAVEIDQINILQATFKAMRMAIAKLQKRPDFILVDGNRHIPHLDIAQKTIVKGDSLSESIAAASIIAKQTRDALMLGLHERWPHYGFDQHKGYATQGHLEALQKYGPCDEHRKSFDPLKAKSDTQIVLELF